jgi:hypothetical protein
MKPASHRVDLGIGIRPPVVSTRELVHRFDAVRPRRSRSSIAAIERSAVRLFPSAKGWLFTIECPSAAAASYGLQYLNVLPSEVIGRREALSNTGPFRERFLAVGRQTRIPHRRAKSRIAEPILDRGVTVSNPGSGIPLGPRFPGPLAGLGAASSMKSAPNLSGVAEIADPDASTRPDGVESAFVLA